jgi:hypothetical protein
MLPAQVSSIVGKVSFAPLPLDSDHPKISAQADFPEGVEPDRSRYSENLIATDFVNDRLIRRPRQQK